MKQFFIDLFPPVVATIVIMSPVSCLCILMFAEDAAMVFFAVMALLGSLGGLLGWYKLVLRINNGSSL